MLWFLQNLASGIISGIALFFTKNKLENIYKEKNEE